MAVVRFIADTHFGHEAMSVMRGFKTVEEHDNYIVEKWNSVVKRKDLTYILGDVTMEKSSYEILDILNGKKNVILGNHDKMNHVGNLLNYVQKVGWLVRYSQK